MKPAKAIHDLSRKLATAFRTGTPFSPAKIVIPFVPAAGDVARSAYFSYVDQGSQPGHDVQHWLAAEARLLAQHQSGSVSISR